MIRLTLSSLPPPISACFTNVPNRGRVPTARYKTWTEQALWEIAAQKPAKAKGEVSISFGLVAPDKRARDAGNLDKALCDVLTKAGVIEDDSNKYVRKLSYEWLADGAPVTVLIHQISGVAE